MPRDALVRRLSQGSEPLIVVSSPGGWGKTVTLLQWAESLELPLAWLQADAADNDPVLFLHYLVSVLRGVTDLDPRVSEWLQLTPPPIELRILPALADAVHRASPFVLIIDDVHLVSSQACWGMVALLFDQLPPGARLCLSGRQPPQLPLGRLRAAGRLLELGPEELALNDLEAHALLRLNDVTAEPGALARLLEATEGWPAGLYLAALVGRGAASTDWLDRIRGTQLAFADYLTNEVLDQQPADVRTFLLRTSILERLSPSLCRAVVGDGGAGDVLQRVAHANLFVSALDDRGEWFRYHHLFAEFLRAELERRCEAEVPGLHGKAAEWFEERGALDEAVHHWMAAGDAHRAGIIVCRAHMHYTHLARYETLRRWLDLFTDEEIFSDQALALAAGAIGSMADDSPRSRLWLSTVFRMQVGDGMWPGTMLPLRAMHLLMRSALAPDGVASMRADAEVALELSDLAPVSHRAAVLAQLGIASWLTGDMDAALRVLKTAQAEGAVGNVLARITAMGYEALILADLARWEEARRVTAVALQLYDEAGLSVGIPVYPALLAQARIGARECDPTTAERVAVLGEFASRGTTAAFMALICEVLIGELWLDHGDVNEAARWMRAAFARLPLMREAGILRPRLLRLRNLIEQRLLLDPLTNAERRILELLPTELTPGKIAEDLCVSPETVRTHMKSIYRKLEAHSRSEALARAYHLGLLAHP